MKEKMKEIAQRVSELRKLSDVKPEEMAVYLKIPYETYIGYEEGKNEPCENTKHCCNDPIPDSGKY